MNIELLVTIFSVVLGGGGLLAYLFLGKKDLVAALENDNKRLREENQRLETECEGLKSRDDIVRLYNAMKMTDEILTRTNDNLVNAKLKLEEMQGVNEQLNTKVRELTSDNSQLSAMIAELNKEIQLLGQLRVLLDEIKELCTCGEVRNAFQKFKQWAS